MDASAQVSNVAKPGDGGDHRAIGAVSLPVLAGWAVAVIGPSDRAVVTDTTGRPAVAATRVTRGAAVASAARRGDRLDVSNAWCVALFASSLQRSDAPDADVVAEAVSSAVRQYGVRGCAGRMAQEFGDHPEAAAERMRWVRWLLTAHKGRSPLSRGRGAVDSSGETGHVMRGRRTCGGICKN